MLLWGRPTEAIAVALGRTLTLELDGRVAPHASIFDCSRMEGAEPGAFRRLTEYVAKHGHLLAKQVRCLAIVRPAGLEGAIVAGAPEVVPLPYPAKVFHDAPAALAWLDSVGPRGAHAATDFAPELDAMYAAATGTAPVVSALRLLLDAHLAGLALGDAARRLGVSDRSLQRKLAEAGTNFQAELADARIRAAKRMLVDTDAPLTTIALEVGCASLQHFSALFRKKTGQSPSAWRRAQRG